MAQKEPIDNILHAAASGIKNAYNKTMDEENKNLLLKDLCARLPYDIKIKDEYGDYINVNIHNASIEHLIDRVVSGLDKMVLRPMSSMTDEEDDEYEIIIRSSLTTHIDWLNKNMFDYRGLIPMGLALEAKDGMYNYMEITE